MESERLALAVGVFVCGLVVYGLAWYEGRRRFRQTTRTLLVPTDRRPSVAADADPDADLPRLRAVPRRVPRLDDDDPHGFI